MAANDDFRAAVDAVKRIVSEGVVSVDEITRAIAEHAKSEMQDEAMRAIYGKPAFVIGVDA